MILYQSVFATTECPYVNLFLLSWNGTLSTWLLAG